MSFGGANDENDALLRAAETKQAAWTPDFPQYSSR